MVEISTEEKMRLVRFTATNMAGVYEAGVKAGAPVFATKAMCWRTLSNTLERAAGVPQQELEAREARIKDFETDLPLLRASILGVLVAAAKGSFFYPEHIERQFIGSGRISLF